MMKNKGMNVKLVVLTGMLTALAYVATLLSKLIPVNVAGFLTFDLKDAVILVCAFMTGPIPAIIATVLSSLIEMLTISETGIIGFVMNVLATLAFVIPAAFTYKKRKTFSRAIIGLVIGVLAMTAVMLLWNWLITPMYMGVERSVIVTMLPTIFLPFNLIKGGINAAITLIIYKPVVNTVRKAGLLAESSRPDETEKREKSKRTVVATVAAVVALATLVLIVLVWTGII